MVSKKIKIKNWSFPSFGEKHLSNCTVKSWQTSLLSCTPSRMSYSRPVGGDVLSLYWIHPNKYSLETSQSEGYVLLVKLHILSATSSNAFKSNSMKILGRQLSFISITQHVSKDASNISFVSSHQPWHHIWFHKINIRIFIIKHFFLNYFLNSIFVLWPWGRKL